MSDERRHPDVFTAAEALAYLHLDPDKCSHLLETLRDSGMLTGWKPGREYLYHRQELDAAVVHGFSHVFGSGGRPRSAPQPQVGPRLRLTGGGGK